MGMLGFEVLEYLGMTKNNGEICAIDRWDYGFIIAGVCMSWRAASLDYFNWIKPKTGLIPTQGFGERKLNVSGTTSQHASWAFLVGKKSSSVLFPPPTTKTPYVLIRSVYQAMR